MFNNIFEKNYSLSAVASFSDDINELKEIWFFCDKCLKGSSCKYNEVEQCENVTIPSRSEALSKAVGRANVEAVHFLVDVAKTDVNGVSGSYEETPLTIAAYYGTKEHQDIAAFLLARGADINKPYNAVGGTPLGVAMWKHNVDFAKFLLKSAANPSAGAYGKIKGDVCFKAINKNLPELFPLIPGCCALALRDLNFDPNIKPLTILQCQGVKH
ncbi:ankyrin repeat domain-containing protein [Klebsiella sp. MISC125]|uniref:ankyrin repeat domain-containing protein n=1 Tax=Klebsiella sp. MISC125 TaxID=2755386 RepID=UPI003DAA1636